MLGPFLTASIFYWKWKQILWKMVTFYTGSETTNNKAQKICAKFLASWDNSWVVSVWPIYFAFVSCSPYATLVVFVFMRQQKSVVTRKKEQATKSVGCDMRCFVSEALLCASLKKTTANLEWNLLMSGPWFQRAKLRYTHTRSHWNEILTHTQTR